VVAYLLAATIAAPIYGTWAIASDDGGCSSQPSLSSPLHRSDAPLRRR
jgi:hypothetical protein